jgi:prophage regulatory protein
MQQNHYSACPCYVTDSDVCAGNYSVIQQRQPASSIPRTFHFGADIMPQDKLDLLRADPGTRTLGQLLQEREWALGEITRLRYDLVQRKQRERGVIQVAAAIDPPRGIRYLRLRDVCQRVGLKQSAVYRLISLGKFPKQVKLSERASAWIESEVEAFMTARIEDRDQRRSVARIITSSPRTRRRDSNSRLPRS